MKKAECQNQLSNLMLHEDEFLLGYAHEHPKTKDQIYIQPIIVWRGKFGYVLHLELFFIANKKLFSMMTMECAYKYIKIGLGLEKERNEKSLE